MEWVMRTAVKKMTENFCLRLTALLVLLKCFLT